jgi:GntR family transcriptional regulator
MAALHARVRAELARRIAAGEVADEGRLPTERALCAEFGVSRVTVRRALAELAGDGLIYAVQGRGTFAAPARVDEPPNALLSFHQLAASRRLAAGARPLRSEVRPATISESELFEVAPGAALFALERLRTLDGLPVAVDHSLVPLAIAPELPEVDWAVESLYARLAAAGHAPVRADYAVEAQGADAPTAAALSLADGAPVLVAESLAHSAAGRVVDAGRIVYLGDRYRFRSTLLAYAPAGPARGATRPKR